MAHLVFSLDSWLESWLSLSLSLSDSLTCSKQQQWHHDHPLLYYDDNGAPAFGKFFYFLNCTNIYLRLTRLRCTFNTTVPDDDMVSGSLPWDGKPECRHLIAPRHGQQRQPHISTITCAVRAAALHGMSEFLLVMISESSFYNKIIINNKFHLDTSTTNY